MCFRTSILKEIVYAQIQTPESKDSGVILCAKMISIYLHYLLTALFPQKGG